MRDSTHSPGPRPQSYQLPSNECDYDYEYKSYIDRVTRQHCLLWLRWVRCVFPAQTFCTSFHSHSVISGILAEFLQEFLQEFVRRVAMTWSREVQGKTPRPLTRLKYWQCKGGERTSNVSQAWSGRSRSLVLGLLLLLPLQKHCIHLSNCSAKVAGLTLGWKYVWNLQEVLVICV